MIVASLLVAARSCIGRHCGKCSKVLQLHGFILDVKRLLPHFAQIDCAPGVLLMHASLDFEARIDSFERQSLEAYQRGHVFLPFGEPKEERGWCTS